MVCGEKCEVYSRIVGYFRPVGNWNIGKKEEFKQRLEFDNDKALVNEFAKESVIEEVSEQGNGAVKV
jgi:ribonucleoside-triphosphate reductase